MKTVYPQIDRALVLSTSHITYATSLVLDDAHSTYDMPSTIVWPCYGYFIWVDTDWRNVSKDAERFPELAGILAFAQARGCQWVRLDCDGPEMAGLPTFDWDVEIDAQRKAAKACCKCGGAITTPLLKDEDERCVHCADYSEDDPDAAELDDSRLFDERQAFVDAQNAARDSEEVPS
jgi:hypothetical protein